MVKATVLVHKPPLFWIVTVCVPAHRLVATFVFDDAGDHVYVYGRVPPLTVTEAVALHKPKQETFVWVGVTVTAVGCTIVVDELAVHPFASVTVPLMEEGHKLAMPAEPPETTANVAPVLKFIV
jgi:hypothetical protein